MTQKGLPAIEEDAALIAIIDDLIANSCVDSIVALSNSIEKICYDARRMGVCPVRLTALLRARGVDIQITVMRSQ